MTEHDPQMNPNMPRNTVRRRLLKAGAASAPVIMTLSAKSALAEGLCVSPSAFASIAANVATSNAPDTMNACHSHTYWQGQAWPAGLEKEALFSSIFNGSTMIAGKIKGENGEDVVVHYHTMTLEQSMRLEGGAGETVPVDLPRDVVSAYLDVTAGSLQIGTTLMDSQDILRDMWYGAIIQGSWSTPWNSTWTRADARAWLDVLIGNRSLF